MFGDRVAGKSRKYLASQTFTASYPSLDKQNRIGSILLWILVFGCKFTESYFFLTMSFGKPIQVMVGMKIQGCSDRFFSNALCTNQAAFTLTIMYIMDLVLFFLDTFLWYIIWNSVQYCAIVHSWPFNLDPIGYLPPFAEEDLRKVVGYAGYGGQVQAQDNLLFVLSLLFRDAHLLHLPF